MSKEQKLIDQINQEQERANLYLVQYNNSLEACKNIMVAYGIITGMLSDILSHEISKGVSAKSKAAKDRLFQLQEIIEGFSKIEDSNKQYRMALTAEMNKNVALQGEKEVLENELAGIKRAWEQTA